MIGVFHGTYGQSPLQADVAYVDSLLDQSVALFDTHVDSSHIVAVKALSKARQINYPLGEAWALERLGLCMSIKANYSKAIELYSNSVKIKMRTGDKTAGWAIQNIGYNYERLGMLDSALHYFQILIDYGSKNKSYGDIAGGKHQMAVINFRKANLQKAMDLAEESLSIAEKNKDTFNILQNLNLITDLYKRVGDEDKTLEYAVRSVDVAMKFTNTFMKSNANLRLGGVYLSKNEFEKAKVCFELSLKLAEESKQFVMVQNANVSLGHLSFQFKKYDEGLSYYKKAVSIANDSKVPLEQSQTLNTLGYAYLFLKKYKLAVPIGEQSFKLAKSAENPFLQRNAAEILWSAYRNLDNYKLALKYHELFKDLADSVSSADFKKSLLEKEMTFKQANDSLRYAREKDLLKTQQEKQNIRERNIRNSIIGGLAALMIFILVVFRVVSLRKQKKYLQATVEKRTEQLNISLTEKEALLKEIHHRVKNNLEVISSLLMLQTNTITDQKAKESLIEGQSRIQSIALIHHKLYRNDDLGSVELKGFTVDLFKQVKDVFNKPGNQVDFSFTGNEYWLSTDKAVPLGLILNELFTNAFKYAVRPEMENRITVTLHETNTDNTPGFSLIYSDNGPGIPDGFNPEKSTSLGMKVIHLLTRQLEGSISVYNDKGMVAAMQFSTKKT